MGGVPSPSSDRSQVEDRSTAIDVMMSGLELPGFRFGRVIGYYGVKYTLGADTARSTSWKALPGADRLEVDLGQDDGRSGEPRDEHYGIAERSYPVSGDLHLDVVALDTHLVGWHFPWRGWRQVLASANVEIGSVPRACYRGSLK